MEWERPSERICELMRSGAEIVVNVPQAWLEEMHRATLSSEYMRTIAGDPVLAEATRRSNRANLLHWAAANISHPGEPVPANLGPEPLGIARDLVRRGLDESAVDAYRIGQNVAWRFWMQIAFGLTSDPQRIARTAGRVGGSIASFIDATIAGIYRQMEIEREELTRRNACRTAGSRRADPRRCADHPSARRKPARLPPRPKPHRGGGVGRRTRHRPVRIWTAPSRRWPGPKASRPLSACWPAPPPGGCGCRAATARTDPRAAALEQLPGCGSRSGPTRAGVEGFRRSHLDAITTQRMVAGWVRPSGWRAMRTSSWSR